MKKIIVMLSMQLIVLGAFSQTFQIDSKVEIYNSGAWYKGSIVQAGTGNYEGYYYVHYDQYSQNQWIKASNIRLMKASAVAGRPRNGMYIILSYGNPTSPIRLGYVELKDDRYTYYTLAKRPIGSGAYNYDSNSTMVSWKSGPFKDARYNGSFEIDREGKTHKIRLNGVTIASNSTD